MCAAAAIGFNIVHRFRHGPKSQLASTTRWFGSISYIYISIFSLPVSSPCLSSPTKHMAQMAFSPFARYSFSKSRIFFRHLIFISFHFRPRCLDFMVAIVCSPSFFSFSFAIGHGPILTSTNDNTNDKKKELHRKKK